MTDLYVRVEGKVGNITFNFEHSFKSKGITVLYGPNGAGKSTIISAIAGFSKNLKTTITYKNIDLGSSNKVPAYKRPFGTMFQNPILFEHLKIKDNLEFAEKRKKFSINSEKIIPKKELIDHLDLVPLLERYPEDLSGGEKLRVVLARTILTKPAYLFLDEPMSEIDIRYKAKLLIFLKMINRKYKIPILYITHSLEEISQIADELILINKGKKIDYGILPEILNNKSFQSLIGKFESSSVLEGTVIASNDLLNITTLDINGQKLIIPGNPASEGNNIRVRIRSRDILVSPIKLTSPVVENELEGLILKVEKENNTAFTEVVIALVDSKTNELAQKIRARVTTYNYQKLNLNVNSRVFVYISSVSIDRQAYQSN
jgi:molybdate transport system ATP-binding protein